MYFRTLSLPRGAGRNGEQFFIVSRGGNFVFRAELDAQGIINIFTGHNGGVIRYQTGNLPTGVVVNASALSLEEASITQTLNARDRQALAGFLTTIDDDTEPFTSDDDRFLDSLK